jgi:hypothetical protein
LLFGADMSATAPYLRKPVLGAYQPDAACRCVGCGRPCRLCSHGGVAALPARKRIRLNPPVGPPCDIDELSPATRQLIIIAQALHGPDWKRPTARDVSVDTKRIWRWLHGQGRPTTSDILRLLGVAKWQIEAISRAYTDVLTSRPSTAAPNPVLDASGSWIPMAVIFPRARLSISRLVAALNIRSAT